ncbi:MAG: monovalent cation/H+ antiporter complex subunit F [Ilumatobacteraceae bacterium]|jgi:multisubunit Na+/H+ antiporter MnhF subunit|nr:monovalent cation/H+ antiporter complex subunit F [Ilumatobacteraceae bacterium]
MIAVALALVSLAGLGFMARLLRGPTIADRVLALDGLLTVVVMGVVLGAAETGLDSVLVTVVVVALVAFVATGVLARYIERRGSS